ncbi:hypothetical protein CYMTET_45176, partial [Cymbomonas tetramitiformis]
HLLGDDKTVLTVPENVCSDGAGNSMYFKEPRGVIMNYTSTGGYVVDGGNSRIFAFDQEGNIEHKYGSVCQYDPNSQQWFGEAGDVDGAGTWSRFSSPTGITGNVMRDTLFVADTHNFKIRQIAVVDDNVTTLAGSGVSAHVDGTGTYAQFQHPVAVEFLESAIYVADQGADGSAGGRVRKISLVYAANGDVAAVVTTLAGNGESGYDIGNDAVIGTSAQLNMPTSIAAYHGYLYVTNVHNVLKIGVHYPRVRAFIGPVAPEAGSGAADGTGTAARFLHAAGIAHDPCQHGVLYVSECPSPCTM